MNTEKELRTAIGILVKKYYDLKFKKDDFKPGKTPIRYAGRIFDEKELQSLVSSSLDFWLSSGPYTEEFEAEFADFLDLDYAFLTNSGSSANLLAFAALSSPLLGARKLLPDDEVIAVAAGFPTTLNPIIQYGMIPVFVDVELGTYNINPNELRQAISPKTKAIFLAHTLGNPYNIELVQELAKEHKLWFIEDCCDALGSKYKGRLVGSFGDLSTYSFYPAHHITMGEGGLVASNNETLARAVRSMRDWGRDCYCSAGENNTCGRRFTGDYGLLPKGYDHKYVYSHIGYNLKVTDMQAAIGVEQLKKLDLFIQRRQENFKSWTAGFLQWDNKFILPYASAESDPAWFAYPVTVRDDAGFTRTELSSYLADNLVETRTLFAGNLLRQPAYLDIRKRVVGELRVTEQVMNSTFFLGTYPGITKEKIEYSLTIIAQFLRTRK